MLITSARILTLEQVGSQLFNSQKFVIHRLIFKKEFSVLLKVFKSQKLPSAALDERDLHGNTPLLLTGKLSLGDEEYLKCLNFLFKSGCNGKLRDGNGWSLIDEAISQQSPRLLAMVFSWLNKAKKVKLEHNKEKVFARLLQIPDFYTEIHWECQSSWIPFLSKIAPSDTFQIWKIGSSVRLDFSLVGFKSL